MELTERVLRAELSRMACWVRVHDCLVSRRHLWHTEAISDRLLRLQGHPGWPRIDSLAADAGGQGTQRGSPQT